MLSDKTRGEAGAIKRISLVRLRSDVPRATCLERWGGEHAEIVRALPGVLEYTVDVAAERRAPGSWDAVATLRFADEAALQRFQEDPLVQERLLATREEFAEAVDVFLVDERVFIPTGGAR
ncbi:MAG: EthD domain-containing protein [Conexibacter sp.]